MKLRNPLTKSLADTLYSAKTFTRLDGVDNSTDYVVLGAAASYQAFIFDYAVVLPVSGKSHTGKIAVSHEGASPTIARHAFEYATTEISGLTFSSDLNGGNIRIVFTKTAVGENPTLFYRITQHPVV